jgi:hypothetical protein
MASSGINRIRDRPDGTIFMGYRKTFNILVALFLVLAVFANSPMAGACFCGQACLHGLQPKTETKVKILFHMLCPGYLCKSCESEKVQTLKAANSATQKLNVKILDTAFILSTLHDSFYTYHILKFDSFYTCGIIPSSPIYLQNLSILC